jgi:hypothetical protein
MALFGLMFDELNFLKSIQVGLLIRVYDILDHIKNECAVCIGDSFFRVKDKQDKLIER